MNMIDSYGSIQFQFQKHSDSVAPSIIKKQNNTSRQQKDKRTIPVPLVKTVVGDEDKGINK